MTDFKSWADGKDLEGLSRAKSFWVWQAAQQAERQRILSIIDTIGVQANSDQWLDACDKVREAI